VSFKDVGESWLGKNLQITPVCRTLAWRSPYNVISHHTYRENDRNNWITSIYRHSFRDFSVL